MEILYEHELRMRWSISIVSPQQSNDSVKKASTVFLVLYFISVAMILLKEFFLYFDVSTEIHSHERSVQYHT